MQAAVLQARQAAQQMQLSLAGGGAVVTSPLVMSEVQDVNEALQVCVWGGSVGDNISG